MAHLIDKDTLENILRGLWKEDDGKNSEHRICYNKALQDVQCEIDSLEVKEVDLDKEADNYWGTLMSDVRNSIYFNDFYKIAKHFFELGMAVSNKQIEEKDI